VKKTLQIFALLLFAHISAQKSTQTFGSERNRIEQLAYADAEKALPIASQLLKNAGLSGNKAQLAKAESTMALVKIYLTATDEAQKLNDDAMAFHTKNKDVDELAKNYFNQALISERQSDYVNSVKYFLKSIANAEKSKDYLLIQKSYRGLAMSYCDQRNLDKALEYSLKSLEYQKYKSDNIQKGYSLAAIGEVYRLKENLPEANRYFRQAFDLFSSLKNQHGMAWVLTNWSICYEYDFSKMTEITLHAQEIWDEIAPENTMSIMNLGNIAYNYSYMAQNDSMINAIKSPKMPHTKQALLNASADYFKRALAIAKRKKNGNAILHLGYNFAELQYMTGNYRDAYDHMKTTLVLNDSIYSQQNKNKIAALESEKKILIRDEKIRLNQLMLDHKKKQLWYLIAGLALMVIIGGLLFNQSRNRRKTNQKLQMLNENLDQANKIKARFFSILNHDLRSPVYNLIHFLHLQKESPELLDAETKKSIEGKTISSAENLLASMEDLLFWSKDQMENFKPQPENVSVNDLFDDLKKHFSHVENVQLVFENPTNISVFTDENYLKTILRNLMANSIKALENTQNATVILKSGMENGSPFIAVSDNGPGGTSAQFRALYDEKEVVGIKTGLGLHLIRDLAKAINCHIAVDSKPGGGTTFKITFA
jgi:signal transduction histidine kinase